MLISVSTLVASVFLFLFFKAIKSGQYDDIHTPSIRMLFDDELVEEPQKEENKQIKIDKETH